MKLAFLLSDLDEAVKKFVADLPFAKPEEMGLNKRAGSGAWVGEDLLVIDFWSESKFVNYGGFEDVSPGHKRAIGSYVIYSADNGKVDACIKAFENLKVAA